LPAQRHVDHPGRRHADSLFAQEGEAIILARVGACVCTETAIVCSSVTALVVLIGATPHTDWLKDKLDLDQDGFVLTGPALGTNLHDREPWSQLGRDPFLLETSQPGIFAVGDVRSGGTRMAAPAVGEGGMAVRFAAEHLARSRTLA
jgi:thioredoxin reductase